MDHLSDEDLKTIEARANAARQGPWTSIIEHRDNNVGGGDFIMVGKDGEREADLELIGATAADQDFIAAARQDVPRLVAEVRALRSLLLELQGK